MTAFRASAFAPSSSSSSHVHDSLHVYVARSQVKDYPKGTEFAHPLRSGISRLFATLSIPAAASTKHDASDLRLRDTALPHASCRVLEPLEGAADRSVVRAFQSPAVGGTHGVYSLDGPQGYSRKGVDESFGTAVAYCLSNRKAARRGRRRSGCGTRKRIPRFGVTPSVRQVGGREAPVQRVHGAFRASTPFL